MAEEREPAREIAGIAPDVAVRLELVRLVHRFDKDPSQVIDVAQALEGYVLGTEPKARRRQA